MYDTKITYCILSYDGPDKDSCLKSWKNKKIFLTFQLHSIETSLHPTEIGLTWSTVKAEVEVTSELFLSGRIRVACHASLYDVYNTSSKLDFFTPETDPRPERSEHLFNIEIENHRPHINGQKNRDGSRSHSFYLR